MALTLAVMLFALPAAAGEYAGASFTAESHVGYDGALSYRYRVSLGRAGYRLEAVSPVEGPDVILARFAEEIFVYIDRDSGAVNSFAMGDADWARFSGVPCADYAGRELLAREPVAGRPTEKWRCIGSPRYAPDATVWWDPALKFQLRVEEDGFVTEFRNIRLGEPDPLLFALPEGATAK